jgi:ribonuclease P protein component
VQRRRGRGRLSVPRAERLQAAEVEAMFRQRGRREEAASFIALWRPQPGGGKVGFAVGRRIGGAVQRNRARRRLREAYRYSRAEHPHAFDIVFVGRPALLSRSFADLCHDVAVTLQKVMLRVGGDGVRQAGV